MMLDSSLWSREQLEQHSVDSRQFLDFRDSTLPNGMRIIEAYNSSGLHFTILPDRGLDIWTAHYKGVPLTWVAQGSPFPPDFGSSWTQQFNGGLMTTCGLTHSGPPETDAQTGEQRDLHGRYSRLRAQDVGVTRAGVDSIDLYGVVREQRLFGEQLELARNYTLNLGEPTIHIADVVTNRGDTPVPFMLLYHFNVGYPLVAQGARLHTPNAAVYPRDEAAKAGYERWAEYDAGTPGYAEQVYFHHVKANDEGYAEAALVHEGFGLSVQWSSDTLPYLTQWKNTRNGIYVSGIEPANCIPEGQNAARQSGRLMMLEPGESEAFNCRLRVLDGAQAVVAAQRRIERMAQGGTPVDVQLEDYAGNVSE